MKIDIERLIDLVEEQNQYYADYCISGKNLYKGPLDDFGKRKEHLSYVNERHTDAQNSVMAVSEVLCMDTEARERLDIAVRAVIRWRIRTNYERLIPDVMKKQIGRFIFSPPSAPSPACRYCGC